MEPSRASDYEAARLDLIRARWDRKAERWDADLADDGFHLNADDAYQRFLDAAEAIVTERAEFCRQSLLVDLGCGTGLVLARFIGRFAQGVGMDLSRRMLDVAARRQLPRTRLIEGNCFELARHVSGAGAVFSRGILLSHYGDRWALRLLAQVRQVLVDDGGFALLDFLNAAARHRYPSNPENKTYFAAAHMEALAREAGFRQASVLGAPERRVLLLLAEH
jgi:SAM-dependent methyltransferase